MKKGTRSSSIREEEQFRTNERMNRAGHAVKKMRYVATKVRHRLPERGLSDAVIGRALPRTTTWTISSEISLVRLSSESLRHVTYGDCAYQWKKDAQTCKGRHKAMNVTPARRRFKQGDFWAASVSSSPKSTSFRRQCPCRLRSPTGYTLSVCLPFIYSQISVVACY